MSHVDQLCDLEDLLKIKTTNSFKQMLAWGTAPDAMRYDVIVIIWLFIGLMILN